MNLTPRSGAHLFFDRTCQTKGIWYYEIFMPDSRKKYPKTKPIRYEEFSDCIRWWRRRKASDNAWYVPVEDVIARGYDLEIPNPSQVEEELPNNPAEVLEIVEKYHADLGAELGALRKLIEEIK